MEILNYALVALVVSIGLILGKILAKIAKEEIKPGKKYLLILQKVLFCAIAAVLIYSSRTNVHYVWIGGLIIFAYLSFFKRINHLIISAILGIGFYLSSSTDHFLLISALIFLYGLAAGSLFKEKKMIAGNLIVFLAVSLLLFLVLK